MNFFTYLYYKYYRFQVRVGNGDIALFTSIMFMECILLVCYSGVLLLLGVIFPCLRSLNISVLMIVGMILLSCILFCWCWLRVWRKKRYKEIIKYYEKTSPKSLLWAVLIPVISFLLFNAGWILMMLQNNGIIWIKESLLNYLIVGEINSFRDLLIDKALKQNIIETIKCLGCGTYDTYSNFRWNYKVPHVNS